jgi:hypothetical protein
MTNKGIDIGLTFNMEAKLLILSKCDALRYLSTKPKAWTGDILI